MKFLRLGVVALTCSTFCFGASKEMIQLQRTVDLLQDKLESLQRDLDTKLGALNVLLSQSQDNSAKANAQLSTLQDSVTNGVGKQLAPVVGLSSKVDATGEDVRSLKEALNDLGGRLERMDAKITDLKNQIQITQNPPAAPGSMTAPGTMGTGALGTAGGPPQGAALITAPSNTPPPGMSAEKTYTDARRDLQTGKTDLAYQEFQQYITYFPNTELAASAQYYLGEIAYNRGDYTGAVQAFDTLLERYPQNSKTADAHLMKGNALMKAGQRNRAVTEYRLLIQNFPRTDNARKAIVQLRALGVSATATTRNR